MVGNSISSLVTKTKDMHHAESGFVRGIGHSKSLSLDGCIVGFSSVSEVAPKKYYFPTYVATEGISR